MHLGHWDPPATETPSAAELPAAQLRLTERLLAMAEIGDGMTVLDVASGLGGTLALLDARYRRLTLVGLEHDRRQLRLAQRHIARPDNHLAWNCGDACQLPYRDQSFDRVLCIEAMFHFFSRRTFFAEAARVMRPGGRLVFSDIVASSASSRLRVAASSSAIAAVIEEGMGPWPDLWCVDADHDALAAAVGLTPLQTVDATAATLPSHACILGDGAGDEEDAETRRHGDAETAVQRAAAMLAWLHRRGHMRVLYRSYRR